MAGALLLALVLALVLYAAAPALFTRLLGLAGMALLVFSVAVMVLTWRRARRVTAWSQIVPVVVSLGAVAVFAATVPMRAGPAVLLASAAFGMLVGAGRSRTGSRRGTAGSSARARRGTW